MILANELTAIIERVEFMNIPISFPPIPLENGDHLSRAEFERRYEAMPDVKKAELIEGVVYMPSPVRYQPHAGPHGDLNGFFFHYRWFTPGVLLGDNATFRLDLENEPQPDGALFIDPVCGGRVSFEDEYLTGGAELIAEISASSASIDLHKKLPVYERNGVCEYIVWRTLDREIDWFVSRDRKFERLARATDGIYRSEVFPGLWLDPEGIIAGDLDRFMGVLQQGIASPEHASFVAQLRARKSGNPA